MADIGQAVQWLYEGKKVRRGVWSEHTYYYLDPHRDLKQCSRGSRKVEERYETSINLWATQGVFAHDWEIYSQPRWKVGDTAYLLVRITDVHRNAVRVDAMGQSIWMEKTEVLSAEEIKEQS